MVNNNKDQNVKVRLPKKLHKEVLKLAKRKEFNISEFIRYLLRREVDLTKEIVE